MKDLKEINERLQERFINKDMTVIIDGKISTYFIIEKAKFAISENTLFITDGKKKQLIIDLDYMINLEVLDYIKLTLEDVCITLDN